MKERKTFYCAGDLKEELNEFSRTVNVVNATEEGASFTATCTALLTIVCC